MMTLNPANIDYKRNEDTDLEKILLEKRAVIAKLRNTIINSPKKKKSDSDEVNAEIEFLLKRF
jgi:hypothetical protein